MRAAPRQPRCPGLLRLRSGSPLGGPGKGALQLGLFSQLKFSFQLRPALRSRARGRALRRCALSPARRPAPPRGPRPASGPTGLASYPERPC